MRNNGLEGFLLIEVLVTVAILAFSLVYISSAFTNALRAMSQIVNYTVAINLAEEKIFQLQSEPRQDAALNEEGIFSDNPNFNFKLEARKLEDFPDVVSGSRQSREDLSEFYLQVNWKEGRRSGSFDISTYLPVNEK